MKDKIKLFEMLAKMKKERNYHYDVAYSESGLMSALHFKEVFKYDSKISILEWVLEK